MNDPDVAIAVCSLTAAGVGLNLQVASNIVLAELSWTDAEQTQAIDRSHRIGQTEPVTAWRIIAAQTIDSRIAELIDSKAGLAARALDGSDEEVWSSADVQHEALVALLTDALSALSAGAGRLTQWPLTPAPHGRSARGLKYEQQLKIKLCTRLRGPDGSISTVRVRASASTGRSGQSGSVETSPSTVTVCLPRSNAASTGRVPLAAL